MTPEEFRATLHPILFRFNGSVTGGMRSEKRNKDKKGNPNSRHLQDMAEDIALDNHLDTDDFCAECRRNGLVAVPSQTGLAGRVHVQVP